MAAPARSERHREGTTLSRRYRLTNMLGSGGSGQVFEAIDLTLNRPVAVKVISEHLQRQSGIPEAFKAGLRAASDIGHPNLVSVLDWGAESDGSLFLVMERLHGIDLRTLVRNHGPLPYRLVVHLTCQVLAGLGAVHKSGLVHGGIRPENILAIANSENPHAVGEGVKILNTGIARLRSRNAEAATQVGFEFLAPEQGQGEQVDARADIYSCGCLAYFLATATAPFSGDSAVSVLLKLVSEPATPPSQRNPKLPREFDAVVLKALAKSAGDRFADAHTMRSELAALVPRSSSQRAVTASATPGGSGAEVLGRGQPIESLVVPSGTATPRAGFNEPADSTVSAASNVAADADLMTASNPPTEASVEFHDVWAERRPLLMGIAAATLVLVVLFGLYLVVSSGSDGDRLAEPEQEHREPASKAEPAPVKGSGAVGTEAALDSLEEVPEATAESEPERTSPETGATGEEGPAEDGVESRRASPSPTRYRRYFSRRTSDRGGEGSGAAAMNDGTRPENAASSDELQPGAGSEPSSSSGTHSPAVPAVTPSAPTPRPSPRPRPGVDDIETSPYLDPL